MRLAYVRIQNFRCLDDVAFTIPKDGDFLSIVGANNAGKSTILDALQLALPDGDNGRLSPDDFRNQNVENSVMIELHFHVTQAEAEHMNCLTRIEKHTDGTNVLKIRQTWKGSSNTVSFQQFTSTAIENASDWNDLAESGEEFENLEAMYRNEVEKPTKTLGKTAKTALTEIAIREGIDLDGSYSWNNDSKLSDVKDSLPRVVYIPAVRDVGDEVTSKRGASFGTLIDLILEQRQEEDEDFDKAIQNLKAAEREVQELIDGDNATIGKDIQASIDDKLQRLIDVSAILHFSQSQNIKDFDFSSRISLLLKQDTVSTDPERQGHGAQRSLILALLEILADQTSQVSDEDNPNPKEIILLIEEPEIYMHPQIARKMRDALVQLAKKAHSQVICTTHSPIFLDLGNRHEGILVLRVEEIRRYEAFERAIDLIENTDSEELLAQLNLEKAEVKPNLSHSILSTRKIRRVIQRADDLFGGEREGRARMRMLLNFDAAVNEVFFAKQVCLVEGDTELVAIGAYAKKLIDSKTICEKKYNLRRRDVTVINCHGKGTIYAFQNVLNGFEIPYVVVHDIDKEDDSTNDKIENLANEQRKPPSGKIIHKHNKNMETIIFGDKAEDIKRDKPWKTTKAIRDDEIADPEKLREFLEFVLGAEITELAPDETKEMV